MVSAASRQQKVAGAIYQLPYLDLAYVKTGAIDGTVNRPHLHGDRFAKRLGTWVVTRRGTSFMTICR